MSKLLNMKVLVCGVRGLGIEIAKDLILAGPGAVTLHDDSPATAQDMGSNFFLSEKNIGKPRAQSVLSQLHELNPNVKVGVHSGALTEAVVAAHSCMVYCDGRREDLVRWDTFCHSIKVIFIAAGTLGALGYVFSDFGPAFTIKDVNGEAPATRIITHISSGPEAVVTLLGANGDEGGRVHGIEDNDHEGWIEIHDVEGLMDSTGKCGLEGKHRVKLCEKTVRVVKEENGKRVSKEKSVFDPYRLKIGVDTSGLTPYENGGVMTQLKQPITRTFRNLEDALLQPISPGEFGLLFTDGAKFGRAEQLHIALLALWEFESVEGRLPEVGNRSEADKVVEFAKKINASHAEMNAAADSPGSSPPALHLDELDVEVIRSAAIFSAAELQPLAAYFGGVVAQEVVKATGKFSPLNQWLHLDFFEVMPEETPADAHPTGDRYSHLTSIYGESFVREKLMNGKTFMVGCGALGCEFLKNFALLGFACGPEGCITVTDNDRIELSNLSRQFLFREHNVGQPKSTAAGAAVRHMNHAIRVDSKETLVTPDSESTFPDKFWEGLDFVTNALDNVKARLYVDNRCVFYGKPLLESGTLGTKCNVQVVVPHLTASYADGPKDQADEDSIPMCTLRNFPSLKEHCIEWARATFENRFAAPYLEAKKFCEDKAGYLASVRAATLECQDKRKARSAASSAIEDLTRLKGVLDMARSATFASCVEEATMMFHELFRDTILQLIHNFPENHVTSTGDKFWTGAKRFPQAAVLSAADEMHLDFIMSAANILAACYGIVPPPERSTLPADHPQRDVEALCKVVEGISFPMWEPTNEKINLDEGEEAKSASDSAADADGMDTDDGNGGGSLPALIELLAQLEAVDTDHLSLEPAEFEKDQDANFHIQFIASAANLRAWNYRIRATSRHEVKMIAGKIIPALATTTASVCGLVMVELLKILQGKKLEMYKDSSNNLGINSYFFSEPAPPEKTKDEYDPISMAEVKCRPAGFTKWDRTIIDQGILTLSQFLAAFKAQTGLNCTLLLHSASERGGPQRGLMLYDSAAWSPALKAVYSGAMEKPLQEWVAERYAPVTVISPERSYVELEVACEDDDDNPFKVPSVVYKWSGAIAPR
jgi:ubiquitin-activating enzyme E1